MGIYFGHKKLSIFLVYINFKGIFSRLFRVLSHLSVSIFLGSSLHRALDQVQSVEDIE